MRDMDVTQKIIGAAFNVHNELGPGFLEKVYENALMIELKSLGMKVCSQHRLPVFYRDQLVGEYFADLVVASSIICEIKAVENPSRKHETQLVNYLVAAQMETGLLTNFGRKVTVRRKFRTHKKSSC